MHHAVVRYATDGIQLNGNSRSNLVIDNSIIQNNSLFGIRSYGFYIANFDIITATNNLIENNGWTASPP